MPTLKDLADRIHREVDIVDLIGRHTEVHQRGPRAVALCPFHEDHKPSMTVDPDKGLYHCFVCKAGGDAIKFIQEIEGVDFVQALELICQIYGFPFEQYRGAPREQVDRQRKRQETLLSLCASARDFFRAMLTEAKFADRGQAYLDQRGIAPDIIEKFELGYAPPGWDGLQRAMALRKFGDDSLVEAGLAIKNEARDSVYDRFRDRAMFPIWDPTGRPIAFGGRVLPGHDDESAPKYINSPETPIYTKGDILYAFHLAKDAIRKAEYAVLCEGYMDVIACHAAGVNEAVASLGTALTDQQVKLLGRLAKRVVFLYDADDAGQKATLRGCELLIRAGIRVFIAPLPSGADPDDLVQAEGASALRKLVEDEAVPALEHLTKWLKSTPDGPDDELDRKTWILDQLRGCLKAESSAVRQDEALRRVAQLLDLDEALVRKDLARQGAQSAREMRAEIQQRKLDRPPTAEQALVRSLLEKPDLCEVFRREHMDALGWLTSLRVRQWIERLLAWTEEVGESGRFAVPDVIDALAADEADMALLREVLLMPTEDFQRPETIYAQKIEWLKREDAKRQLREACQERIKAPLDKEGATTQARKIAELMEIAYPKPESYTERR